MTTTQTAKRGPGAGAWPRRIFDGQDDSSADAGRSIRTTKGGGDVSSSAGGADRISTDDDDGANVDGPENGFSNEDAG